jgi:hypothetical protein
MMHDMEHVAFGSVPEGLAADAGGPPPEVAPSPTKTGKRRLAVLPALTVLVVGSACAGIFAVSNHGSTIPGAGIAPADFVVSATQDTLAQHTADVIFSGSISDAGKVIPLSGTGEADFVHNTFSGTVNAGDAGTSLVERELSVNQHFYMGMTIDGTNMSEITGGPEWIDIPIPAAGGANGPGFGSVDPLTQLQTLEKKGATVTSHGTSVIDGDTVSDYSVTPSHFEELANVESEIASGQITAAEGKQILKVAPLLGTFTTNVWFDASGLLRRESVNIGGGSSGITGTVDMTFDNFGTPVNISAPDSTDIIPYAQFLKDAETVEGSSGGA